MSLEPPPVPADPAGLPVDASDGSDDGGLFAPERRKLVVGLVLTVTLVAFEAMAVAAIMPDVKDDLGGLGLYGWVFSGFFLASLLGIVVAGQLADSRGLVLPYAVGLGLFSAGLVVGGAAGSMPVLVVGRLLQGFGAGAIPAIAYAAIGRGIPAPHPSQDVRRDVHGLGGARADRAVGRPARRARPLVAVRVPHPRAARRGRRRDDGSGPRGDGAARGR